MSIFKVKDWWSNDRLQNENYDVGVQNTRCLKVDKFNSHSNSDCILIGEGSLLKIYKPNADQNVSHTLLETELDDVVLQIETGKFVGGFQDRQIIVLHPRSYAVYQLKNKEGHPNAGDQNLLSPMIKHSFTRRADSLTYGPFGNIKTRDFICIQGLDGSLSFFDQDTFIFMCIFNDIIIPAPISYIENCDSFVICKSTWVLEIYSYQQLREFSELNVRQNKKNVPQWVYNAGEEIIYIQVIQTSSNFSSIIALGERHLCCFQDNGLMKYMVKFEFMPVCFFAYIIGWYYEPGSRLLVMVGSEDSKLFIYEGTTLIWSCDLLNPAISISRCFLKSLPGGIVTLSSNGIVNVGYLGTKPDLNGNVTPMINEPGDPEQIQAELDAVEESLQNILENKEGADNSVIDQIVKIKADVGKPIQNLFQEFKNTHDEALHLMMCPIIVVLTCGEPKLIQSVQITYVCCPPFACSESTVCLDNINDTEIIETQVFLSSEADISETHVKILFTIIDSTGKIVILNKMVLLPSSLYCSPVEIVMENKIKLSVSVNHPCIDFPKIFTDFPEEDLLKYAVSTKALTFAYRSTKKTITFTASTTNYSLEADDFTEITSILYNFLFRLTDYYKRMGVKDFRFHLEYDKEFIKQVMVKFLRSVEAHANERIRLKDLEDELSVLQRQFTVVQKRLLVQYGSLPPGDCDPLELLMKDTHKRLIKSAYDIIQCKENVSKTGSNFTTVGQLIIYLLKQSNKDDFKVKLIEEMMTLDSLYDHYQEWEEAVSQGLSYILNNVFKKSDKDKEKLAPVMEQGILSQINLKRFLKQLRIVLDHMFCVAQDDVEIDKQNVTRIEEFVEVF